MTIDSWLAAAIADAQARGLGEIKPGLEALARATAALRAADFNQQANCLHLRSEDVPELRRDRRQTPPGSSRAS